MGEGLARGHKGHVHVFVETLKFRRHAHPGRLESRQQAGKPGLQMGDVWVPYWGQAADSGREILPALFEIGSGAGEGPHAGDDHAAPHVFHPRRNTAAKL